MHFSLVKLTALFLALCGVYAPSLSRGAALDESFAAEMEFIAAPSYLDDSPDVVPVETPAPVEDEQLDAGFLDEWFADAVMVGDSLVAGMSNYVLNERYQKHPCLGEMKFASASAFTLKKAMECEKKQRTGELLFRGKYMTISQVCAAAQAKKLFIMVGASDLRWYTVDEFIKAYDSILEIVRENDPETKIYITSVVPMVMEYAGTVSVTAEQNRELNGRLQAYCQENGYGYVEIADYVRDEDGYLDRQFSASDYRFHLNAKGKKIWIHSLREIARQEYYEGKWTPSR